MNFSHPGYDVKGNDRTRTKKCGVAFLKISGLILKKAYDDSIS